jgi:SRSO17 transposase
MRSIAHLFDLAASGRKLPRPDASPDDGSAPSAAAGQAGIYVRGLLEAAKGDRNLEDIAETVPGADHQRIHTFISDTGWDESKVLDWVSAQADGLLGGAPQCYIIVDESGFTKKGESSVGVARQYNGRLGKVDNCQVGVFTALAAGQRATLLEGRLYLPQKEWCDAPARCNKAKVPPAQRQFKTKAQIALEMVRTQRQRNVRFNWVSVDGGYGKDPAFLRALDGDGEVFVADVHCDQRIWLDDPKPAPPAIATGKRRGVKPKAFEPSIEVSDWANQQPEEDWIAFKRREGINGTLRGEFLHRRVWVWDGIEEMARCWHLIVWHPENSPQEIKYVLSNARADIAILDLARMAGSRFWVERALQDAKGAVGMAEYQLRGWTGWHHHMAMVMLAMLFMLQQKMLLTTEMPLLSAEDIAWVIGHYLPNPDATEADVQKHLARRHRRRQADIDSRRRRRESSLVDIL